MENRQSNGPLTTESLFITRLMHNGLPWQQLMLRRAPTASLDTSCNSWNVSSGTGGNIQYSIVRLLGDPALQTGCVTADVTGTVAVMAVYLMSQIHNMGFISQLGDNQQVTATPTLYKAKQTGYSQHYISYVFLITSNVNQVNMHFQ